MQSATEKATAHLLWKTLRASVGARVSLGLSATTGLGLCSVPLYGVHGPESAFVLGLLVPCFAAAHVAMGCDALGRSGAPLRGLPALLRLATLIGLVHVAVPALLLAINALFVRQCEPYLGLAYILLGPGMGTWLAVLLAALICSLAARPGLRVGLSLVPPLLGLADLVHNFYFTPAVSAYGHFFGYFPGAFYDRVVEFPWPWLWLRLGTVLLGSGVVLLCQAHGRTGEARLGWRPRRGGCAVLAYAALLLALFVQSRGLALGFDASAAHIQEALGATVRGRKCVAHVPREYPHRARFVTDCDVRVRQMEAFFGLGQRVPVTVYLFRSAEEKRRLMGAGRTNIAKPWRHEVYVQVERFPHPVLAHEVAHVVAGNTGTGPFRIAGRLFGLWPNPGIIEGAAVAADPHPKGDLTPHQWARAAVEADMAPPLEALFGTGFFQQQHSLAYTLAGSFLRFIHLQKGRAAVRRFYRTADAQRAFGAEIGVFEALWHRFLKTVELPPAAAALAQERFAGGTVLSAPCPHTVASLKQDLQRDLSSGDLRSARAQCRAILDVDEHDNAAAATLSVILARLGAHEEAEQALLDRQGAAPASLLTRTRQALADVHARAGNYAAARTGYLTMFQEPQTLGSLRQLQVKVIALDGSARQRELLLDLLLGEDPTRPTDPGLAVHLSRELRTERDDGLPHYLEARQLYFEGHHLRAAVLLSEALARGLPSPELDLEARRVQAICLVAAGQLHEARERFIALQGADHAGIRWEAADFLSRIDILEAF